MAEYTGNVQPAVELEQISNPVYGGGGGGGLFPGVASTIDDLFSAILGGGKTASTTVPTVTAPAGMNAAMAPALTNPIVAGSTSAIPATATTMSPYVAGGATLPSAGSTALPYLTMPANAVTSSAALPWWQQASMALMKLWPAAAATATTIPVSMYASDAISQSMAGGNATPPPTPVVDPNSDLAQSAVDPNLGVAAQSQQLIDYLNMINSEIDLQEQGVLAGQQARYGDLLYQQALNRGMSDPSGLTGGMAEQYSDKLSAAEIAAFGSLDLQTEQMLRDLEMMRLNAPMQAQDMLMGDWQDLAEQISFNSQMAEFYRDQASLLEPGTPEHNSAMIQVQQYDNQVSQLGAQQQQIFGGIQDSESIIKNQFQLPTTFTGFGTSEDLDTFVLGEAGVTEEGLNLYKNTASQLEQLVANGTPGFGQISQEQLETDAAVAQLLTRVYENDVSGDVSMSLPIFTEDKALVDQLIADGLLSQDDVTYDPSGALEKGGWDAALVGTIGAGITGVLTLITALASNYVPGAAALTPWIAKIGTGLTATAATGAAVSGSFQFQVPRPVVEEILTEITSRYQTEAQKLGLGG